MIAIPQAKLAAAWLDLVPRLALAGLIALIVSFIVSYFISRSISGPLARITAASKQMAQGNYDVYIPIKGQDEVGRLSEAFNQMAKEVSTNQRTMRDLLANVSHELEDAAYLDPGFLAGDPRRRRDRGRRREGVQPVGVRRSSACADSLTTCCCCHRSSRARCRWSTSASTWRSS